MKARNAGSLFAFAVAVVLAEAVSAQNQRSPLIQSQRVALDVVKRLNLTANPRVQADHRGSSSLGRESIDDFVAETLLKNLTVGSNVLAIKYRSSDPNQAALIANAFLASTIDSTIAMKAASGEQTASLFGPQLDELRKEVEQWRNALEAFQTQTNIVARAVGSDSEANELMTAT